MEGGSGEPGKPSSLAKWSEATGQAILLATVAWVLFTLLPARWYLPALDLHSNALQWLAFTFLVGAVPALLVLFFIFLASWLIGRVRRSADPWRSYRDGLVVAYVFTLLVNTGMWFARAH